MNGDALPIEFLRHQSGWPFQNKLKRLGVAVSGGGDSMAMLDLMLWHGARNNVDIHVVTVNHGLRAEAADEAAMVAAFCRDKGIDHDILRWSWDGKGNLQAAARDARYGLIARWARRNEISIVTLGHTRDDIAETFLMRLARESGVDGLAAMERRFKRLSIQWERPVMDLSRLELRNYLKSQGIDWAEDPSNEDDKFERVKARKILTALQPLGIEVNTLAAAASNIWIAKSALESYTYFEASDHVESEAGDLILPNEFIRIDRQIPYDVMLRLRRMALQFVAGSEYPARADAMVEMEISLIDGDTHTLHGCLITKIKGKRRFQDRWRISREYNAVKDVACPSDELWDGRWQLEGPHAGDLEIRALGDAVKDTDWRETGLPRDTLRASPAIWRGNDLVAAPIAGYLNGWSAKLASNRDDFAAWLLQR